MRNPDEKHPGQRTFAMALYMIVAFTGVCQMFPNAAVMGVCALLISFFLCKMQRLSTKGTPYATHAEWTTRTLKIGTYYLMPFFMTISFYLIWKSMDQAIVKAAFAPNASDSAIMAFATYFQAHFATVESITVKSMFIPAAWWVRRCYVGFMRAKDSTPIDYPDSII